MTKLTLKALFLIIPITLGGCVTPGDLRDDRVSLNREFDAEKITDSLYVSFSEMPGVLSASSGTMVATGGYFIPLESSGTLNVDPIAKYRAKEVFTLKFAYVTFDRPSKGNYYRMVIGAKAETDSMNGGHTAWVACELYDPLGELIYNGEAEHEILDIQYAQNEPMQRAFYRAYHEILRDIECKLNNHCLLSPAESTL